MEVAKLLVDASATIDVRDNVTGKTALIKAAYVGHADVAEVLLQAGADRNAMDNQGYSALAFSTSFNHIAVLDVLLHAKADPNVQARAAPHAATCRAATHTHPRRRRTTSAAVVGDGLAAPLPVHVGSRIQQRRARPHAQHAALSLAQHVARC